MKSLFERHISLLAAITALAVGALTGCGSGGSATGAPPTPSSATAQSTTVSIGDAPLSGVLAFEVTINNITLTGAKGTVTVLNTPAQVELSHLAGTFEPLTLAKIPADSYSQASVTFGASELLFLAPGSASPTKISIPSLSAPVVVSLNPAIVVPQGASTLNFDLKVADSLTLGASNNVTFNPVFVIKNASVANAGNQDVDNGRLENIKGVLASVSGTQFTITLGGGTRSFTFNTDSTTVFDPQGTTLSGLANGSILEVNGITQADGKFFAKLVEVESQNQVGLVAAGLVISVSGHPPTSLQVVAHEVSGAATVTPNLGSTVTVNLANNTTFRLNGDAVKVAGTSFQFQSANDVAPGQNVKAEADTGNAGSFTAKRIQLSPQTLDGTISGLSNTQFQLVMDPNSTFAKLTGVTSLNVMTSNAENKTAATLANGQKIRVRGFLFFTPASGATASSYTMVAFNEQNP